MASIVTVASLITQAQQRADMEKSNFVTTTEWIVYADNAWKDLYDLLVGKFEDYYTIDTTFTISSGNTATLPANFYKLRGIDKSAGGTDFYPLKIFNFEDRDRKGFYGRYRGIEPYVKYRIMKDSLIFTPVDQATGLYRIWYIPAANTLTATTDTLDGVNGWESYVFLTMAMKALAKEESDVSVLMQEINQVEKRIQEMAANRDAGNSERVTDVTSAGFYDPFFFG